MNPESTSTPMAAPMAVATHLAFERTFLAHERTQMAWIRTALSLISFGFTIAKFFELLRAKSTGIEPLLGPQAVGIIMIGAGLVSLGVASVQHYFALKALRQQCPDLPKSLAWITAIMIAALGLAALTGALYRSAAI